jgi:hypothetical protein
MKSTPTPLDICREKFADRLRAFYGNETITDAQVLIAIARGVVTFGELREALGDVPMRLDDMLDDAANYVDNPKHRALVIFRSRGDVNMAVANQRVKYVALGGVWRGAEKRWLFESGATIEFGVIEKEDDVYRFHGGAWNWLGFHQSEEFSKRVFGTLASRVRPQEGTTRIIRW